MPALASDEDLEARLGRDLTAAETARSAALLNDASALVRGYTRQTFEFVADDVITLRPVGTLCRLPQRPVQQVSQVVVLSGVDTIPDLVLPAGAWTFDGIDKVDVAPAFDANTWVELPEIWWDTYTGANVNTYRITYSHGYNPIPDDVVATVCAMVNRVLLSPSPVEGMVQERIGQYSYGMQQSTGTPGAAVRLSPADKEALEDYRIKAGTIQVIST